MTVCTSCLGPASILMNSICGELVVKHFYHPRIFIFFQMFHQNHLLNNTSFLHLTHSYNKNLLKCWEYSKQNKSSILVDIQSSWTDNKYNKESGYIVYLTVISATGGN